MSRKPALTQLSLQPYEQSTEPEKNKMSGPLKFVIGMLVIFIIAVILYVVK